MSTATLIRSFAILWPILAAASQTLAQSGELNLTYLLKLKSPQELRASVAEYVKRKPNDARALYLQAVIEPQAQRAVDLYERLLHKHPRSEWADDATYHIGQYYFARGLYVAARKHFQTLVKKFPDSPLRPAATYFAASCLCASKQDEPCQEELRAFVQDNPTHELAELARLDLNEPEGVGTGEIQVVSQTAGGGQTFALQVGAFSNANNALNLRQHLASLDYPVEIRKKTAGRRTVYLVLLGTFSSERQARAFGEKFKRDYGKPYRIVRK